MVATGRALRVPPVVRRLRPGRDLLPLAPFGLLQAPLLIVVLAILALRVLAAVGEGLFDAPWGEEKMGEEIEAPVERSCSSTMHSKALEAALGERTGIWTVTVLILPS